MLTERRIGFSWDLEAVRQPIAKTELPIKRQVKVIENPFSWAISFEGMQADSFATTGAAIAKDLPEITGWSCERKDQPDRSLIFRIPYAPRPVTGCAINSHRMLSPGRNLLPGRGLRRGPHPFSLRSQSLDGS